MMKTGKKRVWVKWLLAVMTVFVIGLTGMAMADDVVELGALPSGQLVTREGVRSAGGSYVYFRVTVPGSGYLSVNGYSYNPNSTGSNYGVDFLLCNASGGLIDYRSINFVNAVKNDNDVIYGVKKGTYLVRTEPISSNYKIGFMYTSKKDRGGAKKSKAYLLRRNKKVSEVLPAGSRKSSWFKINAPGNRKVNLTFTGYGQGSYKIQVIGPKMNKSAYASFNRTEKYQMYTQVGLRKTSLRKGTYYIKITPEKYQGAANGWIQLSWK